MGRHESYFADDEVKVFQGQKTNWARRRTVAMPARKPENEAAARRRCDEAAALLAAAADQHCLWAIRQIGRGTHTPTLDHLDAIAVGRLVAHGLVEVGSGGSSVVTFSRKGRDLWLGLRALVD